MRLRPGGVRDDEGVLRLGLGLSRLGGLETQLRDRASPRRYLPSPQRLELLGRLLVEDGQPLRTRVAAAIVASARQSGGLVPGVPTGSRSTE